MGARHFNLDDVVAGAPVQTIRGSTRVFVAHLPSAELSQRLVTFDPEDGTVELYCASGRYLLGEDTELDLVSGPRP